MIWLRHYNLYALEEAVCLDQSFELSYCQLQQFPYLRTLILQWCQQWDLQEISTGTVAMVQMKEQTALLMQELDEQSQQYLPV